MTAEKYAEDFMGGQSVERESVAASGCEQRNDEEYKTETNEISRTRNEAATNGELMLDRESGRKERKRKTQDEIYG